jgi:hypothetical protein
MMWAPIFYHVIYLDSYFQPAFIRLERFATRRRCSGIQIVHQQGISARDLKIPTGFPIKTGMRSGKVQDSTPVEKQALFHKTI